MKDEPSERLDPRARVVWRISAALNMLPLLAAAAFASFALLNWADVSVFLGILPAVVVVALAIISAATSPL